MARAAREACNSNLELSDRMSVYLEACEKQDRLSENGRSQDLGVRAGL
jgi:hypothetical protein